MATQWSFDTYTFPVADSPKRGGSGDWNWEEKLVEHDPLNANVTILTTWGRKSPRRVITGTCGQATRNQMRTFHQNGTVGILADSEGRQTTCRIVRAEFGTFLPSDRYDYQIEFVER